jgi:hypothetical protein
LELNARHLWDSTLYLERDELLRSAARYLGLGSLLDTLANACPVLTESYEMKRLRDFSEEQ